VFCTKCGREQIGSPRFCRSCGAPFHDVAAEKLAVVGGVNKAAQGVKHSMDPVATEAALVLMVIVASFICAFAGFVLGVVSAVADASASWYLPLLYPYAIWSVFWGLSLCWQGYVGMFKSAWGIMALGLFPAYVGTAVFFGFMGGGIYQFIRFYRGYKQLKAKTS
jgi:hypothetical protein